MKLKWLSGSFILLGILLALLSGVADARLSVSSPEGTLERADLIVTGTVIEKNYGDEYRQVTIGVNEILKGTAGEKQIKLERKKNDIYGWTGFDFPEPGTEIFLLLGGDQTRGYWPAGDLNFLAIVDDGHVSGIFKGSKIGINGQSWIQEDYVKVYDAFYRSHHQNKADDVMTAAAFTDNTIKLIVNGRIIETDVSPRLIDGRVMAPIRWIAEALGAEVKWEEETNTVRINAPNMSSIEDALKEAVVNALGPVRGKTEILKVKHYAQGYLVLILQQGKGGGIAVYYVEEGKNGTYTAKGVAGGQAAMSMGFGVNRFILGNDTVFFCNLNESTWIPENDTRKETKYARIIFELDNGKIAEENVENENGYILVSDGMVHVKDMKLYNAKKELVSTYKDIGNSTTEVNYHPINNNK